MLAPTTIKINLEKMTTAMVSFVMMIQCYNTLEVTAYHGENKDNKDPWAIGKPETSKAIQGFNDG